MSPTVAVRSVLQKYAVFSGRARRSEFWWFVLAYAVLELVLEAIGAAAHGSAFIYVILLLVILALIVPGLAVAVRRLHDTDKSGWFILLGLIPFVGGIILIVFYALDGTPGDNRFGPSPKGIAGGYGNAPLYGQPYGGQQQYGQPYGGQQQYGQPYGSQQPPYGEQPPPYGNEPPYPPVS